MLATSGSCRGAAPPARPFAPRRDGVLSSRSREKGGFLEASSSPAQRTAAGRIPNSLREDLLRDVLVGWSRLEPDDAAWDVAGTMLAAAAMLQSRTPCGGGATAAALVDLAGAIEDCAHAAPDASGRARAALERLLTMLPQSPYAVAATQ